MDQEFGSMRLTGTYIWPSEENRLNRVIMAAAIAKASPRNRSSPLGSISCLVVNMTWGWSSRLLTYAAIGLHDGLFERKSVSSNSSAKIAFSPKSLTIDIGVSDDLQYHSGSLTSETMESMSEGSLHHPPFPFLGTYQKPKPSHSKAYRHFVGRLKDPPYKNQSWSKPLAGDHNSRLRSRS